MNEWKDPMQMVVAEYEARLDAMRARITELEANQWTPIERDNVIVELFEMTMEANALEYESEGMAVCRRQGQEVEG